jgi:hypothetical protein
MKMEAICSSETSVNASSIQRHIPEDDILRKEIQFPKRSASCVFNGIPVEEQSLKPRTLDRIYLVIMFKITNM